MKLFDAAALVRERVAVGQSYAPVNSAVRGDIECYALERSAPLDAHLAADSLIRSLGTVELFNKYGRYIQ